MNYPQDQWENVVRKTRKISKDKALTALKGRSHVAEAKVEMERILTAMLAAANYYGQEPEGYENLKETYDVVLKCLKRPIVRLESACYVWMVKSNG